MKADPHDHPDTLADLRCPSCKTMVRPFTRRHHAHTDLVHAMCSECGAYIQTVWSVWRGDHG